MKKSIVVFYEIGLTVLFTVLALTLPAQIKPNNFPVESAPDSSNFEIYSQKNNQIKRANLFALKKYFAPYIESIGYQPAATGNTTHLTEIVSTPNGKVYYIDGKGKATQLYGTQAIHHDETMTGDGTSGSPLSVVAAADDQTITANKVGSNVTMMIEDGNSTTFSINDADANPTNEIQVLSKNDVTNVVTLSKSGGSFTDEVDDADHDTLNEIQFLSYDPLTDSLTLSDGNKVYLGDLASDNQTLSVVSDSLKILRGNAVHRSQFDKQKLHVRSKNGNLLTLGIDYGDDIILNIADEDSSYINELQDLYFNPVNDSLYIQYGNAIYLGSLVKDASPTNEAQTLSKSGSTVTLTSVSGVGGGSFTDEVNDADANPTNEAQTITKSGSTVTLTSVSGVGGGTYADADNQALSINGNQLTISGGNTVTLNPNDADANPTNEIQYLGLNGNVLSITGGNHVTLPSGGSGGSGSDNWGTQYVVTDATLTGTGLVSDTLRINAANPIFADQTITKDDVTNIVSLDKNGGTFVDEVDDADHDPVNEAQTISKSGSTVTLTAVSGSGGGSFSIDDADANPTNEAQTLTKSGNTITLSSVSGSGGGSVTDSDTDAQTLSISGSELSISGGNTVTLPLGSGGDNWGTQVVQHDATLSGSGTASSNLSVAASAASKWTATGSDIYNSNAGSVGIGTAGAPQRKLEVSFNNSANTNLPLRLTNTATSGTNYTGLEAYTGGIKSFDLLGNAGDVRLRVVDNVPLRFYTNNTERGNFSNTGDFTLINKLITPALQVTTSAAAGKVLTSDASGNATWQTNSANLELAGENWVLFGDSFSDGITGEYGAVVKDKLSLNTVTTLAVSGHKMSQQLTVLDNTLSSNYNYFDTYQIVSVLIGVNDFVQNTVLGNRNSAIGSSTFAGYMKDFIETILTATPEVKLYFLSPPEGNGAGVTYQAANTAGWKLKDLSLLMSQICSDYSIQFIDLFSLSKFNLQTISAYTSDGLHPNSAGSLYLGGIIAHAFINNCNSDITTSGGLPTLLNKGVLFGDNNTIGQDVTNFSFDKNNSLLNVGTTNTSIWYGYEFKSGNTLDAYIKQKVSTGELKINSGRTTGWGGTIKLFTDESERMRITSSGSVIIQGLAGASTRYAQILSTGELSASTLSLSGADNRVALWAGTNSATYSDYLAYDRSNNILQMVGVNKLIFSIGANANTSNPWFSYNDQSGYINWNWFSKYDGTNWIKTSASGGGWASRFSNQNGKFVFYNASADGVLGSIITWDEKFSISQAGILSATSLKTTGASPTLSGLTKAVLCDENGSFGFGTAPGDNWGTQVVQHDASLTGSGTAGSPLVAVDASATNEAQTLSKVGSTITLSSVSGSGGGSVSDVDTDDQTLTFTSSSDQLSISEGNSVSLVKYVRRFMLATNSSSHTLSTSLSVIPFSSATGTTLYFTFNDTDDSITPSESGTYRFQFIANLNDTSSDEDLTEFGFYGSSGLMGFAYNNYPRFIANPTKTYINYQWVQYIESGAAYQVKGLGTFMNLSANYTFLIEKISN